jgi:energy-coupling factor transport system ATP-binding protein
MDKIVELSKVTFFYPDQELPSLKDINLTLHAGEFVLLIGPSGCGKTTLLETIAGVIPHATGGRIQGKVLINEIDILRTQEKKRGIVGLILQDPESQLTNLYVEDEIAFGPENLSWPKDDIIASLEDVLTFSRLAKFRRSFVYALSGGQKQRVAIAAGLVMQPEVLLMDGPTTNLDPIGAEEVLQLINRLTESGKTKTVLISANKIDALLPLATRIIVMDPCGSIVLDGTPEDIILNHLEDLKALGVFVPEFGWLVGEFRKRGIEINLPRTVNEAFQNIKPLNLNPPSKSIKGGEDHNDRIPVITIKNLRFGYSKQEVLHSISLDIYKGEALAIVGQNGSGKTTLMKLLAGLRLPTSGTIEFMGKDTRDVLKLGQVGYVFQYPEHQFVTNTVEDELLLGLHSINTPEEQANSIVEELLRIFHLEDKKKQSPYFLSMGEKRRLSVATMLSTRPDVLILDEPTTGLDRKDTENLMSLLKKFVHERGITVIQVSHDMEQVAEFASRVVILNEGNIVFDGSTQSLFADQDLMASCKLMAPPVAQLSKMLWQDETKMPITVKDFVEEVLDATA